jgi:hypothetical protein
MLGSHVAQEGWAVRSVLTCQHWILFVHHYRQHHGVTFRMGLRLAITIYIDENVGSNDSRVSTV